jgi:Di- and tricarboxylate transporters
MHITLIVLAVAAGFFVWGKVRSDVVALCALLILVLFNVLTPEEALSGFSNNIVIMMAGLFVVGGGIFQTGLAKMISSRILSLAGKSEKRLFILVMLVTAIIGAFVSNTGTVALMLPIVVSLAASAGTDARRLLMPMAFASSMGAMLTLIGTPPNMIIHGTLVDAGLEGLSFFSFLPIGIIAIVLGVSSLWIMSKLLVSKKDKDENNKKISEKSLNQLIQNYQIAQNLYRVEVGEHSPLNNKKLKELSITQRFNVSILEIRRSNRKHFRKTVNQDMAGAESSIHANDILYVLGSQENIDNFVTENKLSLMSSEQAEMKNDSLNFGEIGVAELVIMSNSKLVNKQIKNADFRNIYGVNVLGIQRHNEYILQNIQNEKMHAGDVLLIQGKWEDIQKLDREDAEWVVVGQPMEKANKVPLNSRAPVAAAILILMVLSMVFGWLQPVIASTVAAILMVLTGCLRNVESAYKTINWESIVLFAGMIPMSIAMSKTGVSDLVANGIVTGFGGSNPTAVLAVIYLATSCLTLFISNTATAVLFAPIALQTAVTLDVNPLPFMFAVAVGASMCFASPFSTPPNALVMSAGRYSFMDYVKIGLPLQLIYAIVMILVLPLLFPF